MRSARSSLAVTALACAGCYTSYSPPVRSLHAGMPGGLAASRTELHVAILGGAPENGIVAPSVQGLHVGRGLSSTVAIEGGATVNATAAGWLMGWGGLRVTARATPRVVGDGELGFGAGAGGLRYGSPKRWFDLPAWGGYLGAGFGVQLQPWLGVYTRARAEASWGGDTPYTLWTTALVGAEVSFWEGIFVGASAGWAGFWIGPLQEGWLYQLHLTVRP